MKILARDLPGSNNIGEAPCQGPRRRDLLRRSAAFVIVTPLGGLLMAETSEASAVAREPSPGANGRQDFDFFLGHWSVSAKRLAHRLTGDETWESITGTTCVHQILQGGGNVDEDEFQLPGGPYIGGMLRLFDAGKNIWITYGLDRDSGALQPPLSGRFHDGRGEFYGDDDEGGRPIKVRHLYTNSTPQRCRWEQAFSVDGGQAWETNWIIEFTRASAPRTACRVG